MYRPLRVFVAMGLVMIALGVIPGLRFLYFMFVEKRAGHVQSLIFAAILIIVGFQVVLIGLLADLLSCNRKLLEDLMYRVRKMEYARDIPGGRELLPEDRTHKHTAARA
jgi:hypothetical protein